MTAIICCFRNFVLIFLLLAAQITSGQVRTKIFREGIPQDLLPAKRVNEKVIVTTPPEDFFTFRNKNGVQDDGSNRFASSVRTSIDFLSEATQSIENNFKVYALTLKANEALNISLEFSSFVISKNSILSIYTDKEFTDSITSSQNNVNNVWATRVYQGDVLNIVLKEDLSLKYESQIVISKINFGYKNYGMQFGNPGASESCNINVACAAGNGWTEERNSVALIVANGSEACTGALVMNTCGTDAPYVLTANHCLQAGSVGNWVFQFQYWSNTCNGNNGMVEDVQFNGCTLRANHGATDFALLELNQTPASNSGIRYAGWSRQTSVIQNTTILHHPKGDVMKVSVDNQSPVAQNILGIQAWRLDLDLGATEGGSSGAPYFNQSHRIIGQHYGIINTSIPTCSNNVKIGGRFDLSWTGGGSSATRLSDWLDPISSGAMTTNTSNVSALTKHSLDLSIAGDWFVCTSSPTTYTLNGNVNGLPVSWTISDPSIASISANGNQATVTYLADGNITLTATVGNSSCIANNVAYRYIELGEKTMTNIIGLVPPLAVSPGELLELSVAALPGTTTQWSVYGGSILGSSTNSNVTIQVDQCPPNIYNGYITVYCTFTHACGTGTYAETTTIDCSSGGGPLRISPNPANTITVVDIQNSGKGIKEITITDKMGNIIKRIKFSGANRKETVDISMLPSDVYYLQVFDGKVWVGKHISVRH